MTERLNEMDRELYKLEKKSLEFSRDGSSWIQKAAYTGAPGAEGKLADQRAGGREV